MGPGQGAVPVMTSRWFNTVALLLLALGLACSDDSTTPPPPPESAVRNLTQKSDVLANLEYAYNKRRADVYDDMLDNSFTFFYTEGDVGSGTPVQWGRDVESSVTTGLFNGASDIDLTLSFHDGVTWSTQVSGSETWYYTTVFYHFTIKIGDATYIPNSGAKAQFTVRDAGSQGDYAHHWQLVEFRDLGGPSLALAIAAMTQPPTWGQVKALYR